MALEIERYERVFEFNGEIIPDPSPELTVQEIQTLLSAKWPELVNAKVGSPEIKDGKQVFSFSGNLGTKG
jgi:PRTRC genetic system protein C